MGVGRSTKTDKFGRKVELECEDHFAATDSRESSDRYIVRLSFIELPIQLGNSLDIVITILLHLEKRFAMNDDLTNKYRDFCDVAVLQHHKNRI